MPRGCRNWGTLQLWASILLDSTESQKEEVPSLMEAASSQLEKLLGVQSAQGEAKP